MNLPLFFFFAGIALSVIAYSILKFRGLKGSVKDAVKSENFADLTQHQQALIGLKYGFFGDVLQFSWILKNWRILKLELLCLSLGLLLIVISALL